MVKLINRIDKFEKETVRRIHEMEAIMVQMLGSLINQRKLRLEMDGRIKTFYNPETPESCIFLNEIKEDPKKRIGPQTNVQEIVKENKIQMPKDPIFKMKGKDCTKVDCVFCDRRCPFYMWYGDCIHYIGEKGSIPDLKKLFPKKSKKITKKAKK